MDTVFNIKSLFYIILTLVDFIFSSYFNQLSLYCVCLLICEIFFTQSVTATHIPINVISTLPSIMQQEKQVVVYVTIANTTQLVDNVKSANHYIIEIPSRTLLILMFVNVSKSQLFNYFLLPVST